MRCEGTWLSYWGVTEGVYLRLSCLPGRRRVQREKFGLSLLDFIRDDVLVSVLIYDP
jgi:hypothetical protein